MRTILLFIVITLPLRAAGPNPALRWIMNPAAATTPDANLRAILPDVQSVTVGEQSVTVQSAGLSLHSLGPLQADDREPPLNARKFIYKIPLHPRPEEGEHHRTPRDVMGAFLNGVPLYNPAAASSYQNQDIWHFDAVASSKAVSPIFDSLLNASDRHSPLIGFALDGYPIYGPFGWDTKNEVRRFRSSYRLRPISTRTELPDGTKLTPSQEGPPVNPEFPLGTFVEDYVYIPHSGDLDQHNGRFARTPEYPEGTYAYFLSTDAQAHLMYPYLLGSSYYGHRDTSQPAGVTQRDGRVELNVSKSLTFTFRDANNQRIRFLERVHEQPVHLVIVSADLSEFAHIHPLLQPDDTFAVEHQFLHGGTYYLYVDHTPPGEPQTIARFSLNIDGPSPPFQPLVPDLKLPVPQPVRAGEDVTFRFDLGYKDLEPYLGAWAHIMIVSQDHQEFIHAHPQDESPTQHTHAPSSPSPATITTTTGFRNPGLYRLWLQVKRNGEVITMPYTVEVKPGKAKPASSAPAGAIEVTGKGFDPPRITVPANTPVTVAFHRADAQNCASEIIFPDLNIRKSLPPGETVRIDLPPTEAKEYRFTCGMKMYQGSLLVKQLPHP